MELELQLEYLEFMDIGAEGPVADPSPSQLASLSEIPADESFRTGLLRIGEYTCKRCGWSWTPYENTPRPPRACPYRWCHSAYWDRDPVYRHRNRARRPQDQEWERRRALETAERGHKLQQRRLKMALNAADELGMMLTPKRGRAAKSVSVSSVERGGPIPTIPPPPGMRISNEHERNEGE